MCVLLKVDAMNSYLLEVERLGAEQRALQREHTTARTVATRRESAAKKLHDTIADLQAQKQVQAPFNPRPDVSTDRRTCIVAAAVGCYGT